MNENRRKLLSGTIGAAIGFVFIGAAALSCMGPPGPAGREGLPGPRGPQGVAGPQGNPGADCECKPSAIPLSMQEGPDVRGEKTLWLECAEGYVMRAHEIWPIGATAGSIIGWDRTERGIMVTVQYAGDAVVEWGIAGQGICLLEVLD